MAEVESTRYSSYYDYNFSSSYDQYSYNSSSDDTMMAGIVSFFFFLYFISMFILGLIKVKTTANKVFGIIGLSISGIFFLWNFLVIFDPGAISFDEVGGAWMLYSLIVLAFSIVGLVQAVKYKNLDRSGAITSGAQDILDS